MNQKKRVTVCAQKNKATHRFGGRATAGGVNYEVRIAAFVAVKMLSGNRCSVWDGINGSDISAITLQAPEPVDDIIVFLRGDPEACVFISAKERSGTIALTEKSTAFADTVDSFVRQFLKLPAAARVKSRLVWAVPACVGMAATHDLPVALDTHRMDAADTSFSEFLRGRRQREKKAIEGLMSIANKAWKRESGMLPEEGELRGLLRQIYVEIYDFECGQKLERQAEGDIRSHVTADPKQARHVWEKLEYLFAKTDQRGIRVTAATLRRILSDNGLALKSPPEYAEDISRLSDLTARNLFSLKNHTTFRFGFKPTDIIHIKRSEELFALLASIKAGHLLITGEPGCGKSGLIHSIVEALQKEGLPAVLLLAEEVVGRDWKGSANLPGFSHALDEILSNWPNGARGFIITDALDAVRDVETQKTLRRLLRDIQIGKSGWTVIASVREFDLKHGRDLREAFPGAGVEGYSSRDFAGVAHFHLTGLSEAQLDELTERRAEIRPFIESETTKSVTHITFYMTMPLRGR